MGWKDEKEKRIKTEVIGWRGARRVREDQRTVVTRFTQKKNKSSTQVNLHFVKEIGN